MPADVASMMERGTSWMTFARTPVTARITKIQPSMKVAASACWYDTCTGAGEQVRTDPEGGLTTCIWRNGGGGSHAERLNSISSIPEEEAA